MKFKLSHFKFDLPAKLIPNTPNDQREECKLMVVHKSTGEIEHRTFKDLIEYFEKDDVMIFNNTKVFPARMFGNKEKTEYFLVLWILPDIRKIFESEDLRQR